MMLAIIKYNAGNIKSVQNALSRLGVESLVTDDKETILQADKVIFPGVGEAETAMNYLRERNMDVFLKSLTQPFLGICLGQQLMCKHSEEGNTDCLHIFDAEVKKFPPKELVPHMGWNNIYDLQGNLFQNIEENSDVYFIHSYYVELCKETSATCNYILPYSAALQKDNFYATQFHPEKSADIGEQILKNFIEL
ncbi:imidazole glycerol phosphate synthase subunit HisH [Apibacter muscae]|uniref:Imidazole glycerol phosphate synthase subunit HisH n=2 Tax=Apibacter muscae TaxID=2509004 RepID=A0A563DFG4_9FLAO|nr:imidazole glycerol phosphate synthase subunit HisH [Apibacter muscae]TWP30078.1 imidazole glycerol phosphate synthase subunit HisH [Apibacter muscae]